MIWLYLQMAAQISIERILNSLPEGFLIALFAWALLRLLPRQNSGTRFAVWFLALLAIAGLPLLGGFSGGWPFLAPGIVRPRITLPAHWALFAFLAWALAACVALVRLGTGLWHLRGLRRSCIPIDAAGLDPAVRKTVSELSAPRSVTIAISECMRVPAAIGFWKPTIVIPAWALRELPPSELNIILLHEFAHLRRWDDWTNLIQKVVRALFLFHPAVWFIESQLSMEREMACDDAVLAETANPHGYASCLVSLLEKSLAHRGWTMAQAAVHRAREASLRLAQILDTKRPAATRVWKPALGLVGTFAIVCLGVLAHTPQFVAFDRNSASSTDRLYSTRVYSAHVDSPISQPQFQPARVLPAAIVPAAMKTGESSSRGRKVKPYRAQTGVERRIAPGPVVPARLQVAPTHNPVVAVTARADRYAVPVWQTLVFIQTAQYVPTTQYVGLDSDSGPVVWRVQVWRVTLFSPVRGQVARETVANSI